MLPNFNKLLINTTLTVAVLCAASAASAQSAADCQAYAERARGSAPVLRGAGRGAAGGALFGAIAGNAGKGAAIGALVGGIGRGIRSQDAYNQTFDACVSGRY